MIKDIPLDFYLLTRKEPSVTMLSCKPWCSVNFTIPMLQGNHLLNGEMITQASPCTLSGVRPGETNAGKKGLPFGKKNCVPNEVSLGAAGKMRAEASARVLPVMQGFVPGPVSEMLAVRLGAAPRVMYLSMLSNHQNIASPLFLT